MDQFTVAATAPDATVEAAVTGDVDQAAAQRLPEAFGTTPAGHPHG